MWLSLAASRRGEGEVSAIRVRPFLWLNPTYSQRIGPNKTKKRKHVKRVFTERRWCLGTGQVNSHQASPATRIHTLFRCIDRAAWDKRQASIGVVLSLPLVACPVGSYSFRGPYALPSSVDAAWTRHILHRLAFSRSARPIAFSPA
jgi:hypothetical protein